MSSFDSTDPRVQLEVLRERLKNSEERVGIQERDLAQAYINLGRKETELHQIRDERADLKIKWEVAKRDLKHMQELLLLSSQKTTKNRNAAKGRAFSASLIFFLSSGLVNVGTSMLVSTHPNELGWIMMVFASALYLIGAFLTTLLALEGGN